MGILRVLSAFRQTWTIWFSQVENEQTGKEGGTTRDQMFIASRVLPDVLS